MYWIAPVAFILLLLFSAIRVLNEYERGVIFTLGRYTGTKGPGIVLVVPIVQRMVKMDLRTIVLDVPTQDVISRDNVSVKVNAVIYFRVVDAAKAVIQVASPVRGHQSARADDVALRAGPARARRDARAARQAQLWTSNASSIKPPMSGASRLLMSRSSMSIWTRP